MEVEEKTIQDFKEILKRRKWSLIVPALVVFIIAGVVAFALPPTYRSTATILIEEQEVPKEFVVASVTGFAEQRLQTINQTIMVDSRSDQASIAIAMQRAKDAAVAEVRNVQQRRGDSRI